MNIFDTVLGVIAPHSCIGCGVEGAVLCRECAAEKLPFIKVDICFLCGKPSPHFKVCAKCATSSTPQHVWVVAEYKELAKELIAAFKFEYARIAAVTIARSIDEALPYFAEPPVLVFVPTTPAHISERGFEHAALLAKEVARLRAWHYEPALARLNKGQQHGATRIARVAQIKGAFRVKNDQIIAGKHVLLLDDVTTTGATLLECTKMLKKAGAARVDAVVFARTPEK